MRVLLRADGGVVSGAGHIMRCLTLAEASQAAGHDVSLMCGPIDVPWLERAIVASGVTVTRVDPDSIPIGQILSLQPDWVVVDSYRFNALEVDELAKRARVLALVDGDERGLDVSLYLDQNLGAEARQADQSRYLYGARYALIRDDILDRRRRAPWRSASRPRVVSVMGGADSTSASAEVAGQLGLLSTRIDVTMVVPEHDWELVRSRFGDGDVRLLAPTPELPALLGDADIVVSAAGTSTWDLCALGLPSVLIAVVDNQAEPLAQATSAGLTLGISAVENSAAIGRELLPCLVRLLEDEGLRRTLSVNCVGAIDGLGKARVVERLESALHQGRS